MRPWHLGNTTVRSPFRLRDGLVALASSPLGGHIKGRENEIKFAWVLHNSGVVNITRLDANVSDLGRKWRAALSQLGFIVPEVNPEEGITQAELGAPFTITQNGRRLIEADTVAGMQECFLRSLAAYFIPSVVERRYDFAVFSPLRHTLAIMLELANQTGESRLDFIEMALIVQLTSSDNELADIVNRLLELRNQRASSENKRVFDRQAREAAAAEHNYKEQTFNDYADTNFRYLKATGLVQSKGRGLTLIPEKHVFIDKLAHDTTIPYSPRLYFLTLCNGAVLPTDDKDSALAVLDDLVVQLNRRGIPFDIEGKPLRTPADIAVVRHSLEKLLSERNEEEYASRQAFEWEEIVAYMDLINTRRRSKTLSNGEEIVVPHTEAPAYFEWVLWRAFLAINHLINKPYDARRFNIDQDFLPVGTAPGNGPDLIFEFEDYILVVEVTLTDSSRQEAAEGEPVRRHVANIVTDKGSITGKPVYGLFIANRIDSNTAETFRIGCWYKRDDTKMSLDIVPLTLEQFKKIFYAVFRSGITPVTTIRDVLDRCSTLRSNYEAPEWKRNIEVVVNDRLMAIAP